MLYSFASLENVLLLYYNEKILQLLQYVSVYLSFLCIDLSSKLQFNLSAIEF